MSAADDGGGLQSALPSIKTGASVDWASIRRAVRCQRCKVDPEDRYDIIEWKKSRGFLHVEDRLPWLIAEHEAEEGDE